MQHNCHVDQLSGGREGQLTLEKLYHLAVLLCAINTTRTSVVNIGQMKTMVLWYLVT